jgi:hypothetical protein
MRAKLAMATLSFLVLGFSVEFLETHHPVLFDIAVRFDQSIEKVERPIFIAINPTKTMKCPTLVKPDSFRMTTLLAFL